ncbi:MAG TPA: hypothetical protein O0X25_02395 [Methanocorpusculum sp.]|nr:hypothetical protein [Methanocorpusculum sp.]HJJ39966.1 hypothetical protein [Methanocorpusculum sp.]HJJ49450.1 hypothetical protein [Methanocorpusculum sp.]HJJ57001.1 hypothetical protein [Methanocorpusculum sp.]
MRDHLILCFSCRNLKEVDIHEFGKFRQLYGIWCKDVACGGMMQLPCVSCPRYDPVEKQ